MLIKSKTGIHIIWATRPVLFLVIYCLILLNITVVTAKIAPMSKRKWQEDYVRQGGIEAGGKHI